jgi:hypothetical protein
MRNKLRGLVFIHQVIGHMFLVIDLASIMLIQKAEVWIGGAGMKK